MPAVAVLLNLAGAVADCPPGCWGCPLQRTRSAAGPHPAEQPEGPARCHQTPKRRHRWQLKNRGASETPCPPTPSKLLLQLPLLLLLSCHSHLLLVPCRRPPPARQAPSPCCRHLPCCSPPCAAPLLQHPWTPPLQPPLLPPPRATAQCSKPIGSRSGGKTRAGCGCTRASAAPLTGPADKRCSAPPAPEWQLPQSSREAAGKMPRQRRYRRAPRAAVRW